MLDVIKRVLEAAFSFVYQTIASLFQFAASAASAAIQVLFWAYERIVPLYNLGYEGIAWARNGIVTVSSYYLAPLIDTGLYIARALDQLVTLAFAPLFASVYKYFTEGVFPLLSSVAASVVGVRNAVGVLALQNESTTEWATLIDHGIGALQLLTHDAVGALQRQANSMAGWLNATLSSAGLLRGALLLVSLDPIALPVLNVLFAAGRDSGIGEAFDNLASEFPDVSLSDLVGEVKSGSDRIGAALAAGVSALVG